MENFFKGIRAILILTILTVCGAGASAQSAKPKATPKPKDTPAQRPPAVQKAPTGLTVLETELFSEINVLRANPAVYIKYLEQLKTNFSGTSLMFSDGTRMITAEGVGGVQEAINALKNTRPLAPFKLSPGLSKAAALHIADLVKNNSTGHKGSDGSWPPNRVDRYGFWSLEVKENISYRAQTVRDIILNMLIDDGNPKRDHRKNLLSSNLRFAGLSIGESKMYGRLGVIAFAGEFTEKKIPK